MEYRAVFLDLDDTLYPYPPCNEAGKRAALATLRERGYDLDREAFDALYRESRREVKRELAGTASAHERFLYFKRAVEIHTGEHDAALALALGEAYWDAYVAEMDPFPGVAETIADLQAAGVDVAVVTNLTTRIQLTKLDHLGVSEDVDLLLTSEETGREKPGSVMFTLPLARLALRPAEVLMVGDSLDADVEGANAVGLDTALFNGPGDVPETGRRAPDYVFAEFADLSEVVL